MIQRSKQRYSNMLWNMRSITRHKRSYGHPLHPDLTPDVLTCVLPLGTVSSGRESEVESAHLFLTIIQFLSACHLTSQGTDAIPAEVYKAGGLPMAEKLTELFQCMWRKEAIPQDLKDASIIHLYKRKGNPQVCDNHRGISLLSIAGKILAKILLNRLNAHLDQAGLIPESQCGFRKDRGTIDMIFTARQLQEKCQEQNVDLYMTFVDLTKAFDTVSRDGLWKIMAKFDCPPRYIAMVRQFHDGMQARVQNDGEYSEPFPVTNGVKQGCVMAPTLFSMMFSAMLTDAFQDVDAGFPIRYRFDGKLLNLRRLQAKSKVQTDVVDKLLYADDLAENAKSEEKMQGGVDRMSKACDNFKLTISTKKTEVVHQPAPGKPYSEPTITVNGQKLQVVDKFTYLGSTLSRAVHIDDEVTARTAKASVAFGRLRTNVWERNGIRLDTKLKVYKAVVLPTLLYACETWTVYQRHAKKINHFHLSCLRKLLKIRWQDKIPDTEVLKKAKMQSVHTLLKLAQLRWTGHVTRMPDERLPKKVLYGELQEGKRSQGGQKKRYKTPLKPRLRISIFQLIPGNRLLRIEQSGVASSTKVPPNLKKRESVKLKGSVKKGKQEPKNHHQSQHSPNSHALFATDSLELKLAYTAINEHTNTHKRQIFRN